MRVQPKYTLVSAEYMIFPIDAWSRGHIKNFCEQLGITYTEVVTTMGAPGLCFTQQDYKSMTEFLKDYYVDA